MQIAAVAAGNALEYYDFSTYAYFAVYIGRTFFPSAHGGASLLAALAAFGAGFITRPLGAIVIGRFGDRAGRKPALQISFVLMGLAVLGLGLTPSYKSIGIAAPILVVAFRLLQGFALGGESGPSTSFLFEVAPANRRGLFVSLQYVGSGLAALCAGLIGVGLASMFDAKGLEQYGWRVAMLIGVLIVPVGFALRRGLPETLHLPDDSISEQRLGSGSYKTAAVLSLVLMSSGITVSYILRYMTTYAIVTLHMPAGLAFGGTAIGGIVGMLCCPLGGAISDRFGRKPAMIVPWLVLLAVLLPCFYLMDHERTAMALYFVVALLGGVGTLGSIAILATVTESLPRHVRSGAFALIYAVSVAVFGGSAQFMAAWLTTATHSQLAPAWYTMLAVGIGLIPMVCRRETAPLAVALSRAST